MKRSILMLLAVVVLAGPSMAEPCTVGTACPFGLSQITVDISAAQILDSFANPVELVPAPGAGYAIMPLIVYRFQGEGAAYNASGDIKWSSGEVVAPFVNVTDDLEIAQAEEQRGAREDFDNEAVEFTGGATIDDALGVIATSSLGSGGADYEAGDTGSVDGGIAEYVVDTVSGGAVTAFTITNAGFGYAVASGVATTAASGIGTGLTIDIDSITLGSRPVSITVVYSVVEVP